MRIQGDGDRSLGFEGHVEFGLCEKHDNEVKSAG